MKLHNSGLCDYCGETETAGHFLLRPGRDAEYFDQPICLCICLSASIPLEPLDQSARNFVCRSPVHVARSSSDISKTFTILANKIEH